VRLSELVSNNNKDTLIVYGWMFGPSMPEPCSMCTSFIDALNANARDISQNVNLVVMAKSPIDRISKFARGRGWTNLTIVSSSENSFSKDYHTESSAGDQVACCLGSVCEDCVK
jgi:predicted dithiol-disulfide oxidoreductase (DUF899 family)